MANNNFKVGDEVTFANAFGVNVITSIKGSMCKTLEKNTGFLYRKRLGSLKAYIKRKAYWDEQELAAGKAIHKHGDTVFSIS